MLAHGLAERTENDAELSELRLECGRDGDAVKHGVDCDPLKALLFPQRDAELLVSAQQLGIDLVQ